MDQTLKVDVEPVDARPHPHNVVPVAAVIVFTAYTSTLWVANDLTVGNAAVNGAANAVGVVLFGLAARSIILTRLVGRNPTIQIAGHMLLGAAFALLSYWSATVLLGLVNGESPTEFIVQSFPKRAMAWQLLENVTTYGIIAVLSYLQAPGERDSVILSDTRGDEESGSGTALSRYFIRSGEDIKPIDVGTIVSIAGADDYAEVATTEGRHLVRMTLAEFERALDPGRFMRIHRSRIVNIERIERAEPAGGGRLLLHMQDGEAIPASRTGARILRERVL
jgi:hypothetical protein